MLVFKREKLKKQQQIKKKNYIILAKLVLYVRIQRSRIHIYTQILFYLISLFHHFIVCHCSLCLYFYIFNAIYLSYNARAHNLFCVFEECMSVSVFGHIIIFFLFFFYFVFVISMCINGCAYRRADVKREDAIKWYICSKNFITRS